MGSIPTPGTISRTKTRLCDESVRLVPFEISCRDRAHASIGGEVLQQVPSMRPCVWSALLRPFIFRLFTTAARELSDLVEYRGRTLTPANVLTQSNESDHRQ